MYVVLCVHTGHVCIYIYIYDVYILYCLRCGTLRYCKLVHQLSSSTWWPAFALPDAVHPCNGRPRLLRRVSSTRVVDTARLVVYDTRGGDRAQQSWTTTQATCQITPDPATSRTRWPVSNRHPRSG